MHRALAFALLAPALLLAAGGARAQKALDEQAKDQFEQGVDLYNDGKFDQAAVAFGRAFELKPNYKILFNMGQAENELGHYAAALQAYVRYLAEGGSDVPAERAAQVKAEIKRLNALVGMVMVVCDKPGGSIFVDARRQGETPRGETIFVDLGDHEVLVKAKEAVWHREVVRVAGGQRVEVKVDTGGGPAAAPAQPAPEPEKRPAEEAPKAKMSSLRVAGWAAAGAGAALLVASAVTGGLALSKNGDVEDACPGGECPRSERDEIDARDNLALSTDILMGVGLAAAVAGAVMLLVPDRGEAAGTNGAAVSVVPALGPGQAGLATRWRF